MSNKEFFSIGSDRQRDNEIAIWEPGDGLYCSNRRSGVSKVECGVPVAVIRKILRKSPYEYVSKYDREVITKNLCAHHLSQTLNELNGEMYTPTTQADKEAKEFILAKYWDEYQSEFNRRVAEKIESNLASLPESIREAIRNLEGAAA